MFNRIQNFEFFFLNPKTVNLKYLKVKKKKLSQN